MTIQYHKSGDYYLPNLVLEDNEVQPIGKYGRMRKRYNNLKKELERALGRVATLEATVDHMIEENAEKTVTVEKYDTLCRSYGKDYIEGRVREIWNEENLQKQQRKLARKSPDRDAR